MSLLLFVPAGNKEINKGLYWGTSSRRRSESRLLHCALRPLDGWCAQSIHPQGRSSLTDPEKGHSCCTAATKDQEVEAAVCGSCHRPTNDIFMD